MICVGFTILQCAAWRRFADSDIKLSCAYRFRNDWCRVKKYLARANKEGISAYGSSESLLCDYASMLKSLNNISIFLFRHFYEDEQLLWLPVCFRGQFCSSKWGQLLKERICSIRSKFFLLRFDPLREAEDRKSRAAFSEFSHSRSKWKSKDSNGFEKIRRLILRTVKPILRGLFIKSHLNQPPFGDPLKSVFRGYLS